VTTSGRAAFPEAAREEFFRGVEPEAGGTCWRSGATTLLGQAHLKVGLYKGVQ
jgi:hypothetical protein